MTDRKEMSLPLSVSVLAVFIAANGLIRAPFSGGSLWEFIAALIFGISVLPLLSEVLIKLCAKKKSAAVSAALIVFSLLALLPAPFAAYEYCEFVYKAVLPSADMWLIRLVFAVCVLYLALSGDSALYKFAFLSFIFMSAVLTVLFLMSAKTFDFKNLRAAFDTSRFSLADTGEYIAKLILPASSAILYLCLSDKGITAKKVLWGTVPGAFFCLIAVFDSVLSFGLPLASKLDYPYIDDISTVTVGSLFTRMDAFSYFAFFAAYILKCALCIKTAARLIRAALPGHQISEIGYRI